MFLYNILDDENNNESSLLIVANEDGKQDEFLQEVDKIINEICRSYNLIASKSSKANIYKVYIDHVENLEDCLQENGNFIKDSLLYPSYMPE